MRIHTLLLLVFLAAAGCKMHQAGCQDGSCGPGGCGPAGCGPGGCGPHGPGPGLLGRHGTLPPAEMLMHPGPGVEGPGPGVLGMGPAIAVGQTSQVHFIEPAGMMVGWDVAGSGTFDSEPLVAPARYNFPQGAIYRLKLTNIQNRPGLELYPTVEVAPALPRTVAYLGHNAIPIAFTEEDLDQVESGNFVVKVIYLPDPDWQDVAVAGAETLVSTRLDPDKDPVVEADKRGSILAVIRLGNKDFAIPDSPELIGGAGGITPVAMGGPMPHPVAGYNMPGYGMPITGTPIGLPGPPHIPLGGQAGLQKHVIKNHTHMHIPGPTEELNIGVKHVPGFSYPKPANHVYIKETTHAPAVPLHQQHGAPCP